MIRVAKALNNTDMYGDVDIETILEDINFSIVEGFPIKLHENVVKPQEGVIHSFDFRSLTIEKIIYRTFDLGGCSEWEEEIRGRSYKDMESFICAVVRTIDNNVDKLRT